VSKFIATLDHIYKHDGGAGPLSTKYETIVLAMTMFLIDNRVCIPKSLSIKNIA